MNQPTLFPEIDDADFQKYHAENPHIYQQFKRFTFEAINRGRKRFSAEAVINRIRWETMISGSDDFKINNNVKPFYARMFMNEFPQHKGFFETRRSKADQKEAQVYA